MRKQRHDSMRHAEGAYTLSLEAEAEVSPSAPPKGPRTGNRHHTFSTLPPRKKRSSGHDNSLINLTLDRQYPLRFFQNCTQTAEPEGEKFSLRPHLLSSGKRTTLSPNRSGIKIRPVKLFPFLPPQNSAFIAGTHIRASLSALPGKRLVHEYVVVRAKQESCTMRREDDFRPPHAGREKHIWPLPKSPPHTSPASAVRGLKTRRTSAEPEHVCLLPQSRNLNRRPDEQTANVRQLHNEAPSFTGLSPSSPLVRRKVFALTVSAFPFKTPFPPGQQKTPTISAGEQARHLLPRPAPHDDEETKHPRSRQTTAGMFGFFVAERVGFEPTYRLITDNSISSRARYGLFATFPWNVLVFYMKSGLRASLFS